MTLQRIDGNFVHHHSAHCESGSTTNILLNYGVKISEPLVFGIGSGIFYGYFPFIKMQNYPMITYRNMPGKIMKNVSSRLGIRFEISRFKDPQKGMDVLDKMIDNGTLVGLRTGIYWLPYVPESTKIHFNAHHIVVYGRNGDDYLVSDPVFEMTNVCSRKDLMKARFAEGMLAPKGFMFHVSDVPENIDFLPAIRSGIKEACHAMIHFPIAGVSGVRTFAKDLKRWTEKYGKKNAPLFLAHAIRMQEEIGTGGGGFRLMYAAFLNEVYRMTGDDRYQALSKRMMDDGDRWREFAAHGARICKNRAVDSDSYNLLSEIVFDCAAQERQLFKDLWKVVK